MKFYIGIIAIYLITCQNEVVYSLKNEFIDKCSFNYGNGYPSSNISFTCSDKFRPNTFFESNYFDCSNEMLGPSDLNKIGSMYITKCEMSTIKFDIFGNYFGKLITLDISSIGLKSLPNQFFNGANNLKQFFASNNRLTEISKSYFTHAKNVLEVDLSFNRIDIIDEKAFADTNELQILNISHNRISTIHPETFSYSPNLETLDISFNNILKIVNGTFINLGILEFLSLAHNSLTNIESGALVSQKHIETIQLNDNRLSKLDGLKNLKFPSLTSFMIIHNEFNCRYLKAFLQQFQHQKLNFVNESDDMSTSINTKNGVNGVNCRRDPKSATIAAWKDTIPEIDLGETWELEYDQNIISNIKFFFGIVITSFCLIFNCI